MTSSKALFYIGISFILGIFLESITKVPQIFLWAFLFINLFLIIVFSVLRKNKLILLAFCFLVFILGIIRVQISEFNISKDILSNFNGKGEVVFTGTISGEPDIRDTAQMIKVKVGNSNILVTTDRYPEYKYLDQIKITGKLEAPTVTDSFNYKNYLLKDHIYSVVAFPKIELISNSHKYNIFSYFYEKMLFLKQKIRENIQKNFLPPQSSILEGTILGDNGAMSKELKSKLNITGLRHIISVSGTHVVILSSILMSVLLAIGLWRGQAFYIAVFFLLIYIVLTGLPASGIRAGIMGFLYLLAQKIGRQSMGIRVVVLACATMLFINPLLLLYDVGFQLSFLAVVGLIYLEPPLKFLINKLMQGKADGLASIISTTFAAQILTLPIMIYNFGNFSFVAPITNFLVLPIVYWLMIFGFLSCGLGLISSTVGWILSFPCWVLLSYFLKIIDIFSQSWMVKTIENVHWAWLLFSYVIIILAVRFLHKKIGSSYAR